MNIYDPKVLERYLGKGIIVDTKPLVFLLAGSYNKDMIGKNRLTREYTKKDFEILCTFLSKFGNIIVTPQILAEVSNIINKRIDNKNNFPKFIEGIIDKLLETDEYHIKKDDILGREEIKKIGITDTSIFLCSEIHGNLILTKDLTFSLICESKELPVIHFDILRYMSW